MQKITWDNFFIDQQKMIEVRKELYGSDKPGLFVFKNFIPQNFVEHMYNFWVHEFKNGSAFKVMEDISDRKNIFYENCPNYLYKHPYGHTYFNFGFNKPVDEVSHAVSLSINYFRNYIESNNNYNYLFFTDEYPPQEPQARHAWAYRVVVTKNGDKIVAPHRDWVDPSVFKPARLQGTLFLSKKGVDYEGTGMLLESNDGKTTYNFDGNLEINPGDLVLWRYNNLHSIENIKSSGQQAGFVRLIFPPEVFYPQPVKHLLPRISTKTLAKEVARRILIKTGLRK